MNALHNGISPFRDRTGGHLVSDGLPGWVS